MSAGYLKLIADRLNHAYFNGKAHFQGIGLMQNKPKQIFGRINIVTKFIEINPILLNDRKVLSFIIYHELCHSVCGRGHNAEFYRELHRYSMFKEEYERFIFFVREFWISTGYLKLIEVPIILKECGKQK